MMRFHSKKKMIQKKKCRKNLRMVQFRQITLKLMDFYSNGYFSGTNGTLIYIGSIYAPYCLTPNRLQRRGAKNSIEALSFGDGLGEAKRVHERNNLTNSCVFDTASQLI